MTSPFSRASNSPRSSIRWLRGLCLAVTVAAFVPWSGSPSLQAQVPSLDRVDSLTARGEVSGARAVLTSWWDARFETAPPPDRQRALWLRGRLTVDPGMARRDYLRLVLEYPGGVHSADALLRLAQAEHAAGRPLNAARHFEQLLRDYPESPHRLEARRWLDENRGAVSRARAESAESPTPSPSGGAEVEARVEVRPPGEADAAGGGATSPASPSAGSGPVSVQLGAFSSEERARDLVESAEERGIEGLRVVRVDGSRLIRVRAGRFPDRSAAGPLRSRIQDLGFDAAVVTDGEGERAVP